MTDPTRTLHLRLKKIRVDALLFHTSEILPSANVRYLTGFTGSDASVLVTSTERHIFTDGRYKAQVRQETTGFRLHAIRRPLDALVRAVERNGVRRLAIEASRVSHEFVTTLARKIPQTEIVSLSWRFLDGFRIRKTSAEKARIAKAAEIGSHSCRRLLESQISGRSELAVGEELESLFRSNHAHRIAFDTIIASGERGALPHGMPSDKIIRQGELVIIDFGCQFEGYNSDETVTCIVGRPSLEQKKIHETVYRAHMEAIERLEIGMRPREVDRVARQIIDDAGYGKYFLHSLGHGVGLEVHEPPFLSYRGTGVIDEGMVFTIEPGIYLEGVGGVRLESLLYMGRDGPELLSQMPKDLIMVS
ncbi:MAG: aminopeptidase P family protein [Deltaproteobacteria bacterium]